MKTNLEFVKFLERSFSRGDVYILGGFGNVLTAAFVEQKCRQYIYNVQNKALLMSNLGRIGDDCYGKLKAYVWDNQDGEGHYNTNGCPDRNETMALNASTEKGDILTIPKIPGIAVWKDGHVGFVVDCTADDPNAWLVVESYSIARGCLKRTLTEGGWTKWFKDTYLEYLIATPEPQPVNCFEHIIQQGDTYWALSKRYGVDWQDIQAANPGKDKDNLEIGISIRIPTSEFTPAPEPTYIEHIIVRGDTYWALGKQYGISWQAIRDANPDKDQDNLEIGKPIRIPR